MAPVTEVAGKKNLLAQGIHCCPIFPGQSYYIMKKVYVYMCVCMYIYIYIYIYTYTYIHTHVYEGVEILYVYQYYQMTLRVNFFNPEARRIYWFPKQVSFECLSNSCCLSPCIIIYNYNIIINNYDATHQDPILLLKIPIDTRKNFSENYQNLDTHSQIGSPAPI
jgi:hypothetical protein